ncbi:MAG TPA: AAA family ATPase [Burkholderiales bacterium]|nr:AAA family ATPase [Burkholderiales bacterium]
MYNDYFAFSESPFSIVPDPRYLYMSSGHREALAHLLYGVESDGGFVLLTGDVGAGKTTVCRCLLEQLPQNCDVAFIYNPKLTVQELLATICEEFGIHHQGAERSNKRLVDHINAYLLHGHANGRKALLIIDEAQNLSPEVLEQLRLLTNLETNERKLLQIILLGQPELQEILAGRELRQMAQRIVARYHLSPLSKAEVAAYVSHRLTVAGSGRQLFPPGILRRIYRLTNGVPRVINLLCDRALLGCYVQGKEHVDHGVLSKAAREALGGKVKRKRSTRLAHWGLVGALGGSAILALAFYHNGAQPLPPIATPIKKTVSAPAPIVTSASETTLPDTDALTWPEGAARSESESMAMANIFALWDLKIHRDTKQPLCEQAANQGLNCLSERGSLGDLRRLNLPAVLEIEDKNHGKFFAALTSLKQNTAMLAIGDGEVKETRLSELKEKWKGSFTFLWRAPPDYKERLKVGVRGRSVAWLREQLAKANGYNTDGKDPLYFDTKLAEHVKDFQKSEGLYADGEAGPWTLIRLAARNDGNTPTILK